MKLLIELQKIWETGLAMRVVHQDESLRDKGLIFSKDKFAIVSIYYPEIFPMSLFIMGTFRCCDGKYALHQFESEEARDKMYDFIIEAQNEINGAPKIYRDIRVGDIFEGSYGDFFIIDKVENNTVFDYLSLNLTQAGCYFSGRYLIEKNTYIGNIFDEMDAQIELEEFIEE